MMQKVSCVFLFVLWFPCVSAEGDLHASANHTCKSHLLSTSRGSSALLPCTFIKVPQNVSWIHSPDGTVLTLTSAGRVNFFDPRYGRIKVFPNQGLKGNYSISIDNVNDTDVGRYRCLSQDKCVQVELALKADSVPESFPSYIYIICGVAAVILLTVGGFLCVAYFLKQNRETELSISICNSRDVEFLDLGHSAQETGRQSGEGQEHVQQPSGSSSYENAIVYENVEDEPDYLNQLPEHSGISREEEQHNGGFMRNDKLFARLRQASIRKHSYVNQREIQQQTARTKDTGKKKIKRCQYPNPIYNRREDSLEQTQ